LWRLLAASVPPHDLLREPGLVGHGQDAVLFLPAHQSIGADLKPRRTQHKLGIPRAERAQPGEIVDQVQRELSERKHSVDDEALRLWDAGNLGCHAYRKRRAEGADPLGIDGETRSHRMAAEAQQQVLAGGDRRGNIDALHRSRRSPSHSHGSRIRSARVGGDQGNRPAIALHQAAGHDPDDPCGPIGAGEHECSMVQQRAVSLELGLCLVRHAICEELAPRVQRLQVRRNDARLGQVRSRQQLNAAPRVGKTARRIEPRSQNEADVTLIEVGWMQLRGLEECLHAGPSRFPQTGQAGLSQVARVASQQCKVRDDAQRSQVSVLPGLTLTAGPLVERFRDLVCDAHTRKVDEGRGSVLCRQQLGVDDGRRIGQAIREIVMIGDDDVHALRAGEGNRIVGRNASVTGNDQPGPIRDHLVQCRQGDAVTFCLPQGDMIGHATAQLAQGCDEQGCRGLSIYVEVTPDANRFACLECAIDAGDGPRHARERVGR